MENWISVKDRLPKLEIEVLTVDVDNGVRVLKLTDWEKSDGLIYESGYYWCDVETDADYSEEEITHWRPLPNPPQP